MINFGILGCGRIGQVHARGISQAVGANLVALSDTMQASADKLAAIYNVRTQNAEELIQSNDIDAVIIGTPTNTHLELIQKCAQFGKAVFCEKPIEGNVERIQQVVEIVEQSGIPFMTAFNRRFDPNFAHLQSSVSSGDIGAVEIVTILSRDPAAPPIDYIKTSGGIFRDMMIHDLDMARFLLGEEPVTLHAVGSVQVDPAIGEAGDVDTAAVTLTTKSGKICQISNSRRASYGYDQRIEVHGSKGLIRADNLHQNSVEMANGQGFRKAPLMDFFLERYEQAYRLEIQHFVKALINGQTPTPSVQDGLKAQLLAEAAQQSLETRLPVQLSL